MYRFDRVEYLLCGRLPDRESLQFMGEYVEQNFGIGTCIQMPSVLPGKQLRELVVIGKIAVVCKANTVR